MSQAMEYYASKVIHYNPQIYNTLIHTPGIIAKLSIVIGTGFKSEDYYQNLHKLQGQNIRNAWLRAMFISR